MTRDEIIRMAREAGFNTDHDLICIEGWEISPYMQRFAALVAAEVSKCECCDKPHALYCLTCCEESIVQTAVKEEREACARICDGWRHADGDQCADAIRARGER